MRPLLPWIQPYSWIDLPRIDDALFYPLLGAALLVVMAIMLWRGFAQHRSRRLECRCVKCGYPLGPLLAPPTVDCPDCPECGHNSYVTAVPRRTAS